MSQRLDTLNLVNNCAETYLDIDDSDIVQFEMFKDNLVEQINTELQAQANRHTEELQRQELILNNCKSQLLESRVRVHVHVHVHVKSHHYLEIKRQIF
jgi:hypothetical protein